MIITMEAIRADHQAQPRAEMNVALVEQYAADMGAGAAFPALTVFFDGVVHWIADGFHRFASAQKLGLAEIDCDVRAGDLRDAILFSCSANATHGYRRSNDDKRRAVHRMLADFEWGKWSDREIGRRCGVDHEMVGNVRRSLADSASEKPRTYESKHGTVSEMAVANINKNRPVASPKPTKRIIDVPDASEGDAWIAMLMGELASAKSRLSMPPAEAAFRVPINLSRDVRVADLRALSDWLVSFCESWEQRKSSIAA